MRFLTSIRVGLLAGTAFVCSTNSAQTVPPTAPAAPPAVPLTSPASPVVPEQARQGSQQQAQRAEVELNGGKLSVRAENSSLNQILREISRSTGMKISGGVVDERVFGTYGPADPSTVLSTLLRGTGSNMMIILDARKAPVELVLTPRSGGPTPPNPSASSEREDEDLPQQMGPRLTRPIRVQPYPVQDQAPPPLTPAQLAPQMAPQAPATTPVGDSTMQESPNGVKTPQEVYEQLMKMQQQLQQPQPKN